MAELPHFAAFHLLASDEGADALRRYYAPYLAFAREAGVGAVLDTPTWRPSSDWVADAYVACAGSCAR